MAKLSELALLLMLAACAPSIVTPQAVDARAVLPVELDKRQYVRHYLLTTIASDEDLPFTTAHSFVLTQPRPVWVGVYARAPSLWTESAPGLQVVERREMFPEFFHGGCDVVNVVADARNGETLASWCNVDQRLSENGIPRPLQIHLPANSPLQ